MCHGADSEFGLWTKLLQKDDLDIHSGRDGEILGKDIINRDYLEVSWICWTTTTRRISKGVSISSMMFRMVLIETLR